MIPFSYIEKHLDKINESRNRLHKNFYDDESVAFNFTDVKAKNSETTLIGAVLLIRKVDVSGNHDFYPDITERLSRALAEAIYKEVYKNYYSRYPVDNKEVLIYRDSAIIEWAEPDDISPLNLRYKVTLQIKTGDVLDTSSNL